MTDSIPKRITNRDEWEPQHFLDFARTGEEPLNPEWIERRNEVLAEAGLEPEQTGPTAIEDMTPAQHEARRRGE
jgi:hypothetical protein